MCYIGIDCHKSQNCGVVFCLREEGRFAALEHSSADIH